MLSGTSAAFVAAHACGAAQEKAAIAMIKAALPVITSIDWQQVPSCLEVPGVGREQLEQALRGIAASIGLPAGAALTVIQMDDAVPALEVRLEDWLQHVDALDFVDTLFLSVQDRILIHWDFYKNLHAVRF
ncbi:MAG: hypothetical protein GAK31_00571 [Stenotrophomonas maltophilia]|uniref:Uncharacterized protein n=1 Tax=Stenotrophomonas maltophilia TaxID=40324 RepID=A0A7V8JN62_STEMA|nr:MAG: hypothetical protein GAK31_00571 [Stenotrophomonas maltophilia]